MPEPEQELPVLYRDDRYIAIHKPAGLLVHRSPIDKRETRFAIQILREQIGQRVFPTHRLDRPTSGILLFALDAEAASALGHLFQERAVNKTYLAVTRGHLPESGLIDAPLCKYRDRDGLVKSDETQEARTEFRRLAISEIPYPTDRYETSRFSLVHLNPRTGRRHQLRRHLAHIRYPIVGDTRHGCNKTNRSLRAQLGLHRLLLAATELSFRHPFESTEINIHCPPSADFVDSLQTLGLSRFVDSRPSRQERR